MEQVGAEERRVHKAWPIGQILHSGEHNASACMARSAVLGLS